MSTLNQIFVDAHTDPTAVAAHPCVSRYAREVSWLHFAHRSQGSSELPTAASCLLQNSQFNFHFLSNNPALLTTEEKKAVSQFHQSYIV